jgi:hypothetical protein
MAIGIEFVLKEVSMNNKEQAKVQVKTGLDSGKTKKEVSMNNKEQAKIQITIGLDSGKTKDLAVFMMKHLMNKGS